MSAFPGLHSVFWRAIQRSLSMILSAALSAVLLPILLEWLGKARSEPSPEGHRTMIYPRAFGYFGLVFATACWAVAGFAWVSAPEGRAVAILFIAVSLLGLWAYADVRLTLFELSPEGAVGATDPTGLFAMCFRLKPRDVHFEFVTRKYRADKRRERGRIDPCLSAYSTSWARGQA